MPCCQRHRFPASTLPFTVSSLGTFRRDSSHILTHFSEMFDRNCAIISVGGMVLSLSCSGRAVFLFLTRDKFAQGKGFNNSLRVVCYGVSGIFAEDGPLYLSRSNGCA